MSERAIDGFENVKNRVESYRKQIAEFDKLLSDGVAEPPNFDLTDTYRNFAGSLITVREDEHKTELEDFVKSQVDSELHNWVDKVNNISVVRDQAFRASKRIEGEMRELTAKINTHRTRESKVKDEISLLESDIKEQNELLEIVKNPSGFDKATLWILIVGVSLLALATAYYYLATQGQIVVAQNGGPQKYFDSGAEKFSVGEFLKQSPLNILYGVGAIIFFLFGKFAGLVAERYGNPRSLFLITILAAGIVVTGTAGLIGYSSSLAFKLATVEARYNSALERIDDRSFNYGPEFDCKAAEYASDEACVALSEADAALAVARENSGGLTLWVTLSVLLSEVLIGSAVWMYVEVYKQRHHENGGNLKTQIVKMQTRLEDAKTRRDEIGRQVSDMDEAKQQLGTFQGQMANIMARVPSSDAIEMKRANILNREQQKAWAELLVVRKDWPHHRHGAN